MRRLLRHLAGLLTVRLDAVASERHYLDHLLPVFRGLPEEVRGTLYLGAGVPAPEGVETLPLRRLPRSDDLVLVASFSDLSRSRNRRAVLMEHGIGQSYGGDPRTARHPAYAGGARRENVVAFLNPNAQCARRNAEAYPGRTSVVIGSPRLVDLQEVPSAPRGERPVVAVSFHWDCTVSPETRSGWGYFSPHLGGLVAAGFEVLGHAHPRLFRDVRRAYERMGIEPVADFSEVLRRAHVYACDNSSSLYEFAYLRGPVVVLNPPHYRAEVDHGLRFWGDAAIGPHVHLPESLPYAVRRALDGEAPAAEAILDRLFPAVEDPVAVAVAACVDALAAADGVAPRIMETFPRSSTRLGYASR